MTLKNLDKAPFPYFGTVEVCERGHVWRITSNGRPCKPRRIDRPDGSKGYLNVRLPDPATGRWRTHKAHRLVWEWHHGPIPPGMQINHRNLDKADNRIENLELVTPAENITHSYDHGRPRPWSATPSATDAAAEMRRRRSAGALLRELAAEFGISVTHAHRITTAQTPELG